MSPPWSGRCPGSNPLVTLVLPIHCQLKSWWRSSVIRLVVAITNILRLQGIIPCNNLVYVGRRDCIYLKNRHSKRSEYIRLSYRLHNFYCYYWRSCYFLLWMFNSTIICLLICTSTNQLNKYCILHVILHLYKGKRVQLEDFRRKVFIQEWLHVAKVRPECTFYGTSYWSCQRPSFFLCYSMIESAILWLNVLVSM